MELAKGIAFREEGEGANMMVLSGMHADDVQLVSFWEFVLFILMFFTGFTQSGAIGSG